MLAQNIGDINYIRTNMYLFKYLCVCLYVSVSQYTKLVYVSLLTIK